MTRFSVFAALVLAVLVTAAADGATRAARADSVDVLVVLRDQAALPSLPRASRTERRSAVEQTLRTHAAGAQRSILELLNRREREGKASSITPLWIINAIAVRATRDVAAELAARPDVLEVRPIRTLDASSSLATGTPEPNIAHVNAPALWDLGYRGQGVVVANMDTGVDASHPDLWRSWRGGTNSWYDPSNQHPTTPTDVSGHGTWTMGVALGGDAGGTSIGVAPAAQWIAVKIFNDQGVATTAGIHHGFQWLLDPDGNPATDDAPDVVTNSWTMGAIGCDLEFQLDLRSLRAAGILPVFAAGNGGPSASTSYSPANNPAAFAVGDANNSDVLDTQSSRGPSACDGRAFPDLVAPGVDVRTSDLYGMYATETGTSMAAPHVAGALADLLSAFPGLSADRQQSALESGAVDLGPAGADNDTGYGRLDALASQTWLATAPDFTIGASPASAATVPGGTVSFAVDVGALNGWSADVTLAVSGLDASQASWTLTPGTVAGGSGSAQLTVTTASTLAAGSYPLSISGTSGSRTRTATAVVQVSPPPDFTIAASPASASAFPGGSVSYTIGIGPVNGFADPVALSLSGLTTSQASWSFSPPSVTASGTSTLSVTSAASLAAATYRLTITGRSGATTHTAVVDLVVIPAPDFTLSATPTTASTLAGGSVSYTVNVSAKNGFAGTVALTLTGLTSTQASWNFTPSTIAVSGTAKVVVTTASTLAPGTYLPKITGTSGALKHTAAVNLVISPPPDFTLSPSPSSVTVTAGSVASYALSIGSKGGFGGSVTLSVTGLPSGATSSFTVNPVGAPGTSTLKVQTTTATARGTFTLKITGTSGSLVHQSTATLTVR
jgi:subtilisin family serine protease